jgi:hypothetical protein
VCVCVCVYAPLCVRACTRLCVCVRAPLCVRACARTSVLGPTVEVGLIKIAHLMAVAGSKKPRSRSALMRRAPRATELSSSKSWTETAVASAED